MGGGGRGLKVLVVWMEVELSEWRVGWGEERRLS